MNVEKITREITRKRAVYSMALIIVALVITGFVWGQKRVQIIDNGQVVYINTFKSDPNKILQSAGISLADKDEYRLSTSEVADGTKICVYRAIPVKLTYQGRSEIMISGKPTVGEFLTDLGIDTSSIRVTPALETEITYGMAVKVVVQTEQIVQREVAEAFTIVREPDPFLEKGMEEIIQYGENGVKNCMVKEFFDDGVKVGEEILDETIVEPARPQIVKVGARDTIETSRGAMRFREAKYMEATAYLPTDGDGRGITASGLMARHGIVAVDPRVIPLGTRVYVPGYGVALAADTGGAIIGDCIDLCMEDYGDAINFGRRWIKVYILE